MIDFLKSENIEIIFFLLFGLTILVFIKLVLNLFKNEESIDIAKKSIMGKEEIQEDCARIIEKEDETLAILADGLGKNKFGKLASIISVRTIGNIFKSEDIDSNINYFFKKSYNKANKEVLKRIEIDKGGASVLSVLINNNTLKYALIGDVMLYIYRNKQLIKISKGHSMSEVAKRAYYEGKINKREALIALEKEKVLYYVGQESCEKIEINKVPIKLRKNDVVVLMSSGIYNNMKWIEVEKILSKSHEKSIVLASKIIESINGTDKNGTVIVIKNFR